MRFVTVRHDEHQRVALEAESDPHQLGLIPLPFSSLLDVIDAGDALPSPLEWVNVSDVQLLAPVPSPRRGILCVGMNYRAHSLENRRCCRVPHTLKTQQVISTLPP